KSPNGAEFHWASESSRRNHGPLGLPATFRRIPRAAPAQPGSALGYRISPPSGLPCKGSGSRPCLSRRSRKSSKRIKAINASEPVFKKNSAEIMQGDQGDQGMGIGVVWVWMHGRVRRQCIVAELARVRGEVNRRS